MINKNHTTDFNDGRVQQKRVLVLVLVFNHSRTAGLSFVSGVPDLLLFRVYIRILEMFLQVLLTDTMEPCTRGIAGKSSNFVGTQLIFCHDRAVCRVVKAQVTQ